MSSVFHLNRKPLSPVDLVGIELFCSGTEQCFRRYKMQLDSVLSAGADGSLQENSVISTLGSAGIIRHASQ